MRALELRWPGAVRNSRVLPLAVLVVMNRRLCVRTKSTIEGRLSEEGRNVGSFFVRVCFGDLGSWGRGWSWLGERVRGAGNFWGIA